MPKGKGYGKSRSKFVPKKNAHKKPKKESMTLSKEEHALAQLGGGRDTYEKYLSREKKKKR